jgi:LacI family purine nucleotide synthesis repressor
MSGLRVAIMAPNFQSALQAQMSALLSDRLKPDHDIQLLSVSGVPETQTGHLARLLSKSKPDALITVDVGMDESMAAAFRAARIPVVIIDEEAVGVATVTTDNYRGGYLAGDYLAKKGRKRIAVVSGRTEAKGGYNAIERVKGVQDALSANQLSIPEGCLIEVPFYSYDEGVESMGKLLDEKREMDAVFCAAGDVCAGGMLKKAWERGMRIPADISVVGFDDMEFARIARPPLTTIRQPLKEMADAAFRMAVLERDVTLTNPQKVVCQPELIVRESA